jgi:multiple sugar transport system ATP-binding protein
MVFQNYALYPHMSVYENMAFGLKMRHLPQSEIDDRVRMAMDILGLTHLQDRKPKALSGGQRQRVAVGRAIVRQPKLFLFDEPLSNLDAKLRVSMRVQLIKLHKRLGTTMIYVTHDQVEAMSMGERLILLKEGVVQQVGSPLEIYDRPVNQFVASFIGSPPMNFIHCLLTERQGDLFLKGNGFQLKLPVERHAAVKKLNSGASCALVLGVRPEDISERPVSGHIDEAVLTAQVSFLEPLGSEVLATCTIPDHEIVVRLDPRTSVKSDQKVDLVLDLERATLFDPTTTKAIR